MLVSFHRMLILSSGSLIPWFKLVASPPLQSLSQHLSLTISPPCEEAMTDHKASPVDISSLNECQKLVTELVPSSQLPLRKRTEKLPPPCKIHSQWLDSNLRSSHESFAAITSHGSVTRSFTLYRCSTCCDGHSYFCSGTFVFLCSCWGRWYLLDIYTWPSTFSSIFLGCLKSQSGN